MLVKSIFKRVFLQGVSFKTRPIKTLGASLNGPPCLTLLQVLVAQIQAEALWEHESLQVD